MPPSSHVVHNDKERRGVSGREKKAEGGDKGRKAIGASTFGPGSAFHIAEI